MPNDSLRSVPMLVVIALALALVLEPEVVFVSFDGAELQAGPVDDATNDITQISELAGVYAPYGDGEKREAVLQATRANFAAYDIVVTATRPDSGEYVMSVTSPTSPLGTSSGLLGIAPLDCGDAQTGSNVTFAFHGSDDEHSAAATATTISQEVAHSFGLEHVDDPRDIMYAQNVGGTARFVDECLPVTPDAGGTIYCAEQHAAQCGEGDLQNAHAELLTLFGPSAPDTIPPVVEITSPVDTDELPAQSELEIRVTAEDAVGAPVVHLYIDGEALGVDERAPYGWSVLAPPVGTYEIHVQAVDRSGNVGISEPVTVTVVSTSGHALPEGYGPPWATASGCRVHASQDRSSWIVAAIGLALARLRRRGSPRGRWSARHRGRSRLAVGSDRAASPDHRRRSGAARGARPRVRGRRLHGRAGGRRPRGTCGDRFRGS